MQYFAHSLEIQAACGEMCRNERFHVNALITLRTPLTDFPMFSVDNFKPKNDPWIK